MYIYVCICAYIYTHTYVACCPCNDHPMFSFVSIAKYLSVNPLPVPFLPHFERLTVPTNRISNALPFFFEMRTGVPAKSPPSCHSIFDIEDKFLPCRATPVPSLTCGITDNHFQTDSSPEFHQAGRVALAFSRFNNRCASQCGRIHAQTLRRLGASTSPDHRPGSHFG